MAASNGFDGRMFALFFNPAGNLNDLLLAFGGFVVPYSGVREGPPEAFPEPRWADVAPFEPAPRPAETAPPASGPRAVEPAPTNLRPKPIETEPSKAVPKAATPEPPATIETKPRLKDDAPKTAPPQKALDTLDTIKKTGAAPNGYKGGGKFANDGRNGGQVLPRTTPDGKPITYKEYDVNPLTPGVNRGTERIVIGSDGRSYYTSDHYATFTEIP
jgi:guanyl-specific ribonuclease Sa